jgi:hypothetical protein
LFEDRVFEGVHQSECHDLRKQALCERWVFTAQHLEQQWKTGKVWRELLHHFVITMQVKADTDQSGQQHCASKPTVSP